MVICVEDVFGYASLEIDFYLKYQAKIDAIVNDKGWRVVKGKLGVGILPDKDIVKLEFGDKPDKKTMKKMMKERKAKV